MTKFCNYVGIKSTVTSKKDGVSYDVHLFQNGTIAVEVLTEEGKGSFVKGEVYPIESYKGSDGRWKNKIVSVR